MAIRVASHINGLLGLSAVLGLIGCSATDGTSDQISSTDQALGCAPDPANAGCVPVQDARARWQNGKPAMVPPSLEELRGQHKAKKNAEPAPQLESAEPSVTGMPVPGGFGTGIAYMGGALQALNSATLSTKMIVYPEGTGDMNRWLFTTATNRTEKGVEVVGIFLNGPESIGVFDWSCAPDYPCDGGATSPSWIWTRWINSNTCYYRPQDDGGGHVHNAMNYRNKTEFSGGLWHNQVTFWNYCTTAWDLVYSHDYAGPQKDCSVTGDCGWWGPILETFFDDWLNWPIPELGFSGGQLTHDGVVSNLPPSEADFWLPGPVWNVCHRTPNSGWTAGDGALCPAITERFASSAGQLSVVDGTWGVSGGKYRITTPRTGSTIQINNRAVDATAVNGDFILTASASAASTSGTRDNFAVIFDWLDANDYYYASFAEGNDTTVSGIFKVQNGYQSQIGDITSTITPGTTYNVRIERDGVAIRVYRNNVLQGSTNDATFMNGLIGLGARNNSATFDDLIVNTPRIDERFDVDAARWENWGGSWSVAGGVYQLTPPGYASPYLNNQAVHFWPLYGDFNLTTRVAAQATASTTDNVAVIFDWRDPSNFWFASFGEADGASTNGIFKVENGVLSKLTGLAETFPPGMGHDVQIIRSGNTITVNGKGRFQATVTDASLSSSWPHGKFGFGSQDTAATFDNLVVY